MKRLKLLLMTALASISFLAAPSMAYAISTDDVCSGVNFANGGGCDATAETSVQGVVKLAIQILQMIVGIISVFVLITAGLGYITSGGDAGKTKTAKDRILYAAIGLVVVALAQVIVSFVLNRVESV
jgi:hypothetical protein